MGEERQSPLSGAFRKNSEGAETGAGRASFAAENQDLTKKLRTLAQT